MAGNDYIVRLQGLDNLSGVIKNVKNSITELGGSASKLDNIQQRFNRIELSSAPLKKKLADVKRAMEELAASGDTNSALFNNMAAAAQKYQKALDDVNNATKQVASSNGLLSGNMGGLLNVARDVASKSGFGGIATSLTSLINPATAAAAGVAAVGAVMVSAAKAATEFETHLDSLQSLTGLTDEAMKGISDGAINMSKEFRSSANDIVDSMKLIGSQAPELLKDSAALMDVTKSANVLAEAAQIGVVDAAKGITTVMNQMGASASESSDIINVLAAASQQGAADVAYLNTAFEKAGTAARSAGMSYTELSAAVEAIAPKFSSADVAGSQLSSTLLKLSIQGNNDFKPSVVGMQQALENLSAAELSDAEIKGLVGAANVTMLKSLIEAKDTFADYTLSLTGTNTAFEQMATNNDNFEGSVARIKSQWDAFLITLGQSGIILDVIEWVGNLMSIIGSIIDAISDVIKSFDAFGEDAPNSIDLATVPLNILKDIIEGIGVAVQILVTLIAKAFNAIKDSIYNAVNSVKSKWDELNKSLSNIAFVLTISAAWSAIYNRAAEIIGKLKKLWNDFMKWLGLESKSASTPAAEGVANLAPTPATATAEGTTTTTSSARSGGGTVKVTSSSSSAKASLQRTDALKYEAGSLADLEAQYKALNDELQNTVVSDDRVKEINDEKEALEEEIKQLKIRNGLIAAPEEKKDDEDEEANNEAQKKDYQEIKDLVDATSSSFENLGSTVGGTAGAILTSTGQMMNAMAQLIPQIMSLTAAKEGEAIASGTASAAAMPFPANIAAIAAIVALITSVFASIAGAFADGGIVGGSQYHGDNLLARVNAGEMILNPSQQSNLFRALDSGGAIGGMGGKVEFEISGTSLKGTLRNYDKKVAKMQ